jgi:hypothetical protein
MKYFYIFFLFITIILISCSKKESEEKKVDDFTLSEPKEKISPFLSDPIDFNKLEKENSFTSFNDDNIK